MPNLLPTWPLTVSWRRSSLLHLHCSPLIILGPCIQRWSRNKTTHWRVISCICVTWVLPLTCVCRRLAAGHESIHFNGTSPHIFWTFWHRHGIFQTGTSGENELCLETWLLKNLFSHDAEPSVWVLVKQAFKGLVCKTEANLVFLRPR